ncbi:MAG: acetate--CoA ligase family protein [Thermodesulfobacteriota bacterium]
MNAGLDAIFNPRAVAVVGASDNPGKLGFHVVKSLVTGGYQGRILPINPKGREILGQAVYPSLAAAPGQVDLAIIVVPAQQVPAQIRACADKGVRGVVLITAGFKEIEDASGSRLQEEVAHLANQAGLPIIGPNTFGILNLRLPVNTSFTPELSLVPPGGISLLSQSGGIVHLLGSLAVRERVGMAKIVGLGNRCNVDFAQMLPYLAQDPQTAVVAMYMEGIEDQALFLERARELAPHKPLIVLKVGTSEVADQASASHTGSLAGRHELYLAGFRQNGLMVAQSVEQLLDGAKALAQSRPPQGPRMAVLSGQAGPGIAASDVCARLGLSLGRFTPATQERINDLLPPLALRSNPVDLGPAWYDREAVTGIVQAVLDDEQVDGVLFNMVYASANLRAIEGLHDLLVQWNQQKPVLASITAPPGIWDAQVAALEDAGALVNFPSPERAVQAMATLYERRRLLDKLGRRSAPAAAGRPPRRPDQAAQAILDQARARGQANLSEHESKALLAAYGIPVNRGRLAASAAELEAACSEIGFPLALKAEAPELAHKSERGLVRLDLRSLAEVRAAWAELQASAPGPVLVQEMVQGQRELVMGLARDPQFGPSVMFGLGGVFTEVLQDVSFRLAPLDREEALEMMQEVRGRGLLGPVRGLPPADQGALADMLVALGRLGVELPAVAEVDLNPVILAGGRPVAVDALVVLAKA